MFKILDRQGLDFKVSMDIELDSNDTINESELKQMVQINLQEFFVVTAQIAIVGYGSKDFKSYIYNGEKKSLQTFFRENKVHYTSERNTKLEPNTLTPRRLCRLFRYQLKELLVTRTEYSSYLFRKYSSQDEKFRAVCFPGAEHLVEGQEASYLLSCYRRLDEHLEKLGKQANICERIIRVYQARNLSIPN